MGAAGAPLMMTAAAPLTEEEPVHPSAELDPHLLEPLAANPVMGFAEVVRGIGRFIGLLSAADRLFARDPPDLVLPVDYPGFNVNLSILARRRGVRVLRR